MGLMASVAIGIALIVDFLFLPPLLIAVDKQREPIKHSESEKNIEPVTVALKGNQA
jgi:predicted RND superfamily exporter protein